MVLNLVSPFLQLHQEASDKILKRYRSECLRVNASEPVPPIDGTLFSFEIITNNSTFNESLYARLVCAIEAGKNVTEEYELSDIWEINEPVLQGHLENLTNCASAGSQEDIQNCYYAEIPALDATYSAFLAAVKEVCSLLIIHGQTIVND